MYDRLIPMHQNKWKLKFTVRFKIVFFLQPVTCVERNENIRVVQAWRTGSEENGVNDILIIYLHMVYL